MSNEFDFADYDFDDDDFDYVRPPDKPIREILNGNTFNDRSNNDISNNDRSNNDISNNDISNNDSNFDAEFEQCLIESQLSFLSEKKRHEEEEKEKERKMICDPIRNKLERVKCYDIANKEIYETIFSVIDKWELSQIEYFETDKDTFESIFNLITSIRMTKDEHKFLINLFYKKSL
jgi:hypothetical protein